MATKADFTDEEWKTMQKGVTGAGLFTSVSDPDFTDTFGESSTLAKYLAHQQQSGETDLTRELAKAHGGGFGFAGAEKVERETLAALRTSLATLGAKAPDEVDPYRRLVLGAAEAVAEAKGGVTDRETAAIGALKEAVGQT